MSKNTTTRILGVDPGTNILGFSIIDVTNDNIVLIEMDVLRMTKLKDHPEKLKYIFNELNAVIKKYKPNSLAIEAPFFGKNVQSMLKLGRAQGVAMAAGLTNNLNVFEYAPKKIKQSITGKGNASKEQVSAMLKHIINADFDEKLLDGTDALGAAVCHHYQSRNSFSTGIKYNGWKDFLTNNESRLKKN